MVVDPVAVVDPIRVPSRAVQVLDTLAAVKTS